MRDQKSSFPAEVPDAMGVDDITFEELLAGEPTLRPTEPMSFKQLLKEGFPYQGGLERLALIEQMPDPGPQLAEVRRSYLQILEMQRRGAKSAPKR
jgi:hypothetical protein